MNKIFKEILSWCIHICVCVAIVLMLNTFVFQLSRVQGKSMEPTLYEDNVVVINKLSHTFKAEFDYGDIVIIDSRVNDKRSLSDDLTMLFRNNIITGKKDGFYWVKRVIGKPGDILEFKEDYIIRNGEKIEEEYLTETPIYSEEVVEVPEGHIYVLGDNRSVSYDSRNIGPVPLENAIGKVWIK